MAKKLRMSVDQYTKIITAIKTIGTIANLIERFMHANPSLGQDHKWRYRMLQRKPFSWLMGNAYKREDVIEYFQERSKEVGPATCMHDYVCFNNVLKYAGSGVWKDTRDVSAAELIAAKPFLVRERLIGKSQPRDRRPTAAEHEALDAYFAKQNDHDRTIVDMLLLSRWQRKSSRRVGESCKLLWLDWAPRDQTTVVRGVKDPKRKGKIRTAALPNEASDMLWEMAYEMNDRPELRTDEPRIFPFNSKTATQRYVAAKIALGIQGLRLHDSRRDCISNLAERGHSSQQIRMVSLHETTTILDRTYNRPDPAKFKDMQPAASPQ